MKNKVTQNGGKIGRPQGSNSFGVVSLDQLVQKFGSNSVNILVSQKWLSGMGLTSTRTGSASELLTSTLPVVSNPPVVSTESVPAVS